MMKAELDTLFGKYKNFGNLLGEIVSRGYVFPDIEKSKILFTGINPSYTMDAKIESFGYTPKNAVNDHQHFNKISGLACYAGLSNDWTFLDLFYYRETKQELIWDLAKQDGGLNFLCEQLQLTQNRIEKLRPDIIVVCNNLSRSFWGIDKKEISGEVDNVWMGYNFEYHDSLGIDVISGISDFNISGLKTSNLLGTPVVFTSTLTYMNKSDLRRLGWHINFVLQNWHQGRKSN